jgi:hypothetical protein
MKLQHRLFKRSGQNFFTFYKQNNKNVKKCTVALKLDIFPLRGHSVTTWTEFCHFLTLRGQIYTVSLDQNRNLLTPSLPHHVNVVIE